LELKAEVNQQTLDGTTALHLAAEKDSGPIARMLLKANADQTLVTREKRAALHVAAENGAADAAAKLLEPSFDDSPTPSLNMQNDRGETALARAAMRGHATVLKQILDTNANFEMKNWWGQGPLQLACQGGHTSCVQALLFVKAELDLCAQDGSTPLHAASEKGHAQVVEFLILNKANLERRASGARLPLHSAASRGSPKVVEVLLKYKAKLEERNDEGRTPLSIAASRGHTQACRVLLDRLADPQALDSVKQTPLHAAAANGQVDCVELLLDYRTRIDALDASARSPIMLAHANQQESVVRVMLKRGAVLPDGLDMAHGMGDVVSEVEKERLQEMLQESTTGKSASLMRVAERDFEDCRQRLLELAGRQTSARTAPSIHYLENILKDIIANYKMTEQVEGDVKTEARKFRDLLTSAQAKQAHAEQTLKSCTQRAEEAKETMKRKQQAVVDMKKQLTDVKASLAMSLSKGDKLDQQVIEARNKREQAEDQMGRLTAMNEALNGRLVDVSSKLAEWHDMRKQAAILHNKTQELLNRENCTTMSTPREDRPVEDAPVEDAPKPEA
jgi:ankyrin repeat protein